MKRYQDYFIWENERTVGQYPYPQAPVDAMFRDVLAELEINSRNIKQLDICLSAELATINTRIAKLEDRLELWESVPQTLVIEEGEGVSTDSINPFTPTGYTTEEVHQAILQLSARLAALEARKP